MMYRPVLSLADKHTRCAGRFALAVCFLGRRQVPTAHPIGDVVGDELEDVPELRPLEVQTRRGLDLPVTTEKSLLSTNANALRFARYAGLTLSSSLLS